MKCNFPRTGVTRIVQALSGAQRRALDRADILQAGDARAAKLAAARDMQYVAALDAWGYVSVRTPCNPATLERS